MMFLVFGHKGFLLGQRDGAGDVTLHFLDGQSRELCIIAGTYSLPPFTVNLRQHPNSLFEQLEQEGRLQPLLPDLELPVLDARCYDRHRGVVFRERSPEDLII